MFVRLYDTIISSKRKFYYVRLEFLSMTEKFELVSSYEPRGDQPKAIEKLVEQIEQGHNHLTLLGATGTGKTFTISNVIERVNRPTLVIAHNKTLAGQLYSEFK